MTSTLMKVFTRMRVIGRITSGLKYRYYSLGITLWAKMHCYFRFTHDLLLGINKRTRIKLIQHIALRLGFKVFELCNFCFERYGFFLIRACQLNERHAFTLHRRKF